MRGFVKKPIETWIGCFLHKEKTKETTVQNYPVEPFHTKWTLFKMGNNNNNSNNNNNENAVNQIS